MTNHKQAHRSLLESVRTMNEDTEGGATKGKMLSCAADLEDMLEGNEKTASLAKKAESIQRAIRKAFKTEKVEEAKLDESVSLVEIAEEICFNIMQMAKNPIDGAAVEETLMEISRLVKGDSMEVGQNYR